MGAILTRIRKDDRLNLKWSDYRRESRSLYFYEKKKMANKILNEDMIKLPESMPRGENDPIFATPKEEGGGGDPPPHTPEEHNKVLQDRPGARRGHKFSVP